MLVFSKCKPARSVDYILFRGIQKITSLCVCHCLSHTPGPFVHVFTVLNLGGGGSLIDVDP